mgnify:CR=1 FL=1
MVEARYGEISSDVSEKADSDEFDSYDNAYSFDSAEEYKHEEGTYDEEGAEGAGYERDESLENI